MVNSDWSTLPLILSASKYFRYISLSFYICRGQNEHFSMNSVRKTGRVELCQIFHPSNWCTDICKTIFVILKVQFRHEDSLRRRQYFELFFFRRRRYFELFFFRRRRYFELFFFRRRRCLELFLLLMVHTVTTKKISPVLAYLHTFLTVCRNFFDFLIVKMCQKNLSQNLGHLRLRGTIFLVVGVKMSKNQTSTFEKFSHLLNPIGRLNQ